MLAAVVQWYAVHTPTGRASGRIWVYTRHEQTR